MKYSLLTLILWVMDGVAVGFGVTSVTRTAPDSPRICSRVAPSSQRGNRH